MTTKPSVKSYYICPHKVQESESSEVPSFILDSQEPEDIKILNSCVKIRLVRLGTRMKVFMSHPELKTKDYLGSIDESLFSPPSNPSNPVQIPPSHNLHPPLTSFTTQLEVFANFLQKSQKSAFLDNLGPDSKNPFSQISGSFLDLLQSPSLSLTLFSYLLPKETAQITSGLCRQSRENLFGSNSFWYGLYVKRWGRQGFKEAQIAWRGVYLKK